MNYEKNIGEYLKELKVEGLPYSARILDKNNNGSFDVDGLGCYDLMPNVFKVILLESPERDCTLDNNKFLLVEVYKLPTSDGSHFGVPSFSYIHDVTDDQAFSCYMLNDNDVQIFKDPAEAVGQAIKAFELDNYQRIMSVNYIDYDLEGEDLNDELMSLLRAEAIVKSFNNNDFNLYETNLDLESSKLTVNCKKYDRWVDVIDTGTAGSIHNQLEFFLNETFIDHVKESVEHALIISKNELKNTKKNINKPS